MNTNYSDHNATLQRQNVNHQRQMQQQQVQQGNLTTRQMPGNYQNVNLGQQQAMIQHQQQSQFSQMSHETTLTRNSHMQAVGGTGFAGMSTGPGHNSQANSYTHGHNNPHAQTLRTTHNSNSSKSSTYTETPEQQITEDWQNREYIEEITGSIKKMAQFLNEFDMTCRHKLAVLKEKLTALERRLDFLEARSGLHMLRVFTEQSRA